MPYSYHQLGPADADQLRTLLAVFGTAFHDVPTYQSAVPDEAYQREFLAQAQHIVLVALDGEQVVGGLVSYVLPKFEQVRKEIYIYDLAVDEAHRRRGIARELIRVLQKHARKIGAYVIYVQADHGDAAAIQLYSSLGKKEDVYHFDIHPHEA